MKVVGCQPYVPAAFTPGLTWYSFLEAESTPGHMELSDATEKIPATPGIDPGTFRLVAQCLNHYTTPGPHRWENNIKINIWGMGLFGVDSCGSGQEPANTEINPKVTLNSSQQKPRCLEDCRLSPRSRWNCALLSYYAACSGNSFSTFRDNLSVPSSHSWSLNLVPIAYSETSIKNYHYALRNSPKQRSSASHVVRW
jgi:hypothetical protein